MRRRQFITLLGGAAAWPITARAQQPKLPVIGFLNGESAAPYASRLVGFRDGLSESGLIENKNVTIEYSFAEGKYDRLGALASDLVRRQVAVVVATGGSLPAAKAATTTIPIVFAVGDDPVKSGFVASLARPGGNLTGTTSFTGELGAKRVGLLHELLPKAMTIALLRNPGGSSPQTQTNDIQLAARAIGQQLLVFDVVVDRDIDAAFDSLSRHQNAALFVANDTFFLTRAGQLIGLAARYAIPTIFPWREFAEAGGLMSYGTSESDVFHNVGLYAGQIIKGAKPGDMPVLLPTKFDFAINLNTAKALGLTVPNSLLVAADEVIE